MRQFTEESLMSAQAPTDPYPGRIVFAGTPEIAAEALHGLLESGAEVAGVLTRPDAPMGRRRRMAPSPVAQAAEEAGIPVIRADRVDEEVVAQLKELDVQLGVVVAYGALLPQHALDALPRGWVNLHYSWLPKHRGAAPVQHSILAGDEVTAATVFQLEPGMDTGPVHGLCEHPLPMDASAGAVLSELTQLGTALLRILLPDLLSGRSHPEPQQGEPSLAPKLNRDDAFIDPEAPAEQVRRRVNATIPEPGAWTLHGEDPVKLGPTRPFKEPLPEQLATAPVGTVAETGHGTVILRTGDGGAVVLTAVQPAGKKMINVADWLRGQRDTVILGAGEEHR